MTASPWICIAGVSGAIAVSVGAFGAHGLEGYLQSHHDLERAAKLLATFETGVRYHMYHTLALVAVALLEPGGLRAAAGWMFLSGSLLFSGSLYLYVLTEQLWLVWITPMGGVFFIAGWLALAVSACRSPHPPDA